MRRKILKIIKKPWFLVICGVVVGAVIIVGIRVATYHKDEIHYHANYAVYINGQQEKFKGPQYYQEVSMCILKDLKTPEARAHMHDNIYDVVHVEDHSVTWGHLFINLGWSLGPNFIQTADQKMYAADGTNQLNVIINGQDYTGLGSFANRVIQDNDKLLISYGAIPEAELQREYKAIPSTAKYYDNKQDPATCSGHQSPSLSERLKHAF